jgi:hypothetical protein
MASTFTSKLEPERLWRITERSTAGLRVSVLGSVPDPSRALRGELTSGSLLGEARQAGPVRDLVGTYDAFLFLISPAFSMALGAFGAKGWGAIPVDIPGADKELSLLVGTGRVGPIIRASEDAPVGDYKFGRFLGTERWDGSDLFVPDNENVILVTDDLAAHLRQSQLSNLELESAGLEALPPEAGSQSSC